MKVLIFLLAILALNIVSVFALPAQTPLGIVNVSYGRRCACAAREAEALSPSTPQKVTKGTIVAAVLAALLFVCVILSMALIWNHGWRDNVSAATRKIFSMFLVMKIWCHSAVDKIRSSFAKPLPKPYSATSSSTHHRIPSSSYMSHSRAPMAQVLPGSRLYGVQAGTLPIAGMLSGPGPVGEIGRSERDSVVKDSQSVKSATSSSAADLGV